MNDKVTPRDYNSTAAHAEDRSPDEIERDIEQTRAEMDYTLTALEHKLSPSQFMDQAMSYLRGGSGEANEFATNLGRTIKNNPLPVALLGVGLAWLMMAGPEPKRERRYYPTPSPEAGRYPPSSRVVTPDLSYATAEPYSVGAPGVVTASGQPATSTSPSASSKLKETVDRLKAGAGDAQSRVSGTAHATGERISQTAHDVSEGVSRTAHDVSERVSQTAHDVRERAGQVAHGASERMSHAAHEARLRMEHTAETARHQAQRLSAAAQHQAERARQGFDYMLQEQPLVLGAVGVALGAVLGASLPPTRREDELMGRRRDELLEQTKAAGREQLQKAERVAEAARDAALAEAEREGLTREEAEARLRGIENKLEHVAGAAKDAAQEEAQRQNLGSAGSSTAAGSTSAPGNTSTPGSTTVGSTSASGSSYTGSNPYGTKPTTG